jgi:predicted AAA+ superfamily ATPase
MYIEREIAKAFDTIVPVYNIIAIVGPRQAGKTTFLKERLNQANGSYIMFDDPDAKALFDEDIKKFENQYMQSGKLCVLDEIQYGKDAGRKLKYLADKGRKIWITSSSQTTLGSEVLSWLVGRVSILKLYPFSFNEFMLAKGQREANEAIIKRNAMEHIIYGGYPKVVLEESYELKIILLRDLNETMILKDVARTFSIEDINSLELFSRYLAQSIGNVLIYEKISSSLKTSFQTIKKYLNAMEKSYLISVVEPFYTNKLKEITKQPKIYFIDTGLRNSIINNFPKTLDNEGKLFENYVFCELTKLGKQAKYWQTKSKAEVDFIIEKEGYPIPIEVKVSAGEGEVEKSLRAFIETYEPKLAIVVFYAGIKKELKLGNCKIIFTDINGLGRILSP